MNLDQIKSLAGKEPVKIRIDEPHTAGVYAAVVLSIVHCGEAASGFNGGTPPIVLDIGFALSYDKGDIRHFHSKFNMSSSPKSYFGKLMKSANVDDEANIVDLIGNHVLIHLVKNKEYVNFEASSPLTKAFLNQIPEVGTNDYYYHSVDSFQPILKEQYEKMAYFAKQTYDHNNINSRRSPIEAVADESIPF